MPAPSLVALATKACIRNVQNITSVGDFQYSEIRSILARVQSPEQLRRIELASPQICGEDAELWKHFIARDIANWEVKNYVPKNSKSWSKVYLKYKSEQRKEIERDEERLREAMMGLKKEKESNVSKVVKAKLLPKLPRDPRMIGTDGVIRKRRTAVAAKAVPSTLTFSSGSRTKMTDGKSVLLRAKREAHEMRARSKLVTPSHLLRGASSKVARAPQGMVDEYRNAAKPRIKILGPRRDRSLHSANGGLPASSALEERERKLRAIKGQSASDKLPPATTLNTETLVGSSSEDEGDDNLEDLFGAGKEGRAKGSKIGGESHGARRPQAVPARSSAQQNSPFRKPPPKPSAIISSIVSKPGAPIESDIPGRKPASSSPVPQAAKPVALTNGMNASPAKPGLKLLPPRKRPEVDIFNRGASKRPRVQ